MLKKGFSLRRGLEKGMLTRGGITLTAALACASCNLAGAQDVPQEFAGTFVFHRGNMVLTTCDGTTSTRVAIIDGYPELARAVYPRRASEKNGVRASIRGRLRMPESVDAQSTRTLVVAGVIAIGEAVECDPLATDRPFADTTWVYLVDGETNPRSYALRFDVKGFIDAYDGCNRLSGRYELVRNDDIVVGDLMSTMIVCRPDAPSDFQMPKGGLGKFTIRGRIMTLTSTSGRSFRFLAREWD